MGFYHLHKDGVDWVFVDHISYHREGTPYGNAAGTYGDNLFRFSLLCMAACEAPLLLHVGGHRYGTPPGLPYGQVGWRGRGGGGRRRGGGGEGALGGRREGAGEEAGGRRGGDGEWICGSGWKGRRGPGRRGGREV